MARSSARDHFDYEMHQLPSMYDTLPEPVATAMKMNEQRRFGRVDDVNGLPPLDLGAIGGLWYNRISTTACYQPSCMTNVTAQYQLDYANEQLQILNSGTCCGVCLCQARGIATPSPKRGGGGTDLAHGPRDFHVTFCINDDWSVRACARNCAPMGGLQLLEAGYMASAGGGTPGNDDGDGDTTTLNMPVSRPASMTYSSGPYDYLVVGNRERTKTWLLVRHPDQSSPFDADEAEDNEAGRLTNFLHRWFGYSQTLYYDLKRTMHTNPMAHEGHGYLHCNCV